MSLREWGYWGLALGVSLCAHGWLWLAADAGMDTAGQGAMVRQRVMLVGLRSLPAPVPAVVEPEAGDEAPPPKPPEPPVRQPLPQAVPEPKPPPPPAVAPRRRAPAAPRQQSALPEARPAPAARPVPQALVGAHAEEGLERRRLEYLEQLAAYIDRHKFYPRSARRRGLEGQVRVVFRVSPEGRVSGLTVRGEHGVLERAAAGAVRAAQPLPLPPPGLPLPEKVSFVMEYRLR